MDEIDLARIAQQVSGGNYTQNFVRGGQLSFLFENEQIAIQFVEELERGSSSFILSRLETEVFVSSA